MRTSIDFSPNEWSSHGFRRSSLVVFDYLFYDRVFHGLFHGPDGLVQ